MSVLQRPSGHAPAVLQLNVMDGTAREDGPYACSRPLRVDGASAYLFLAAEATGPDPQGTCQGLLQGLLDRLSGGRRSVTGRLQAALTELNTALLLENARSLPAHQSTASAACALLIPPVILSGREERKAPGTLEGEREANLYVAVGGPAFVWLFGEDGARDLARSPTGPAPCLGSGKDAQVWVYKDRMEPGGRLVLLSSRAGLGRDPQADLTAFWDGLEEGMARLFNGARGLPAFGGLAVEQREWEDLPEDRGGDEGFPEPRPYSYGRPWGWRSSEPEPAPEPMPRMASPRLPITIDLRMPITSTRRLAGPFLPRLAAALGLLAVLGLGAVAFQAATQERQAQAVAHAAAQFGEAADLFRRAGEAATGDGKRKLLKEAAARLEAVRKQEPENPEAAALSDRVQGEVARLDAVHQLADSRALLEGSAPPGSSVLFRKLVEQSGTSYVLDKSGDRVLQLNNSQSGAPFYQARNGANRRSIVALLTLPRGGAWPRDSILALDDSRGLMELRSGADPRPLPLRGAADWGSFQAAAGFDGSLYVLDPKSSQVYRYVPTEAGFDTERRPVLPSIDLRDAIDLAVDGDVYVLLRTGRVLKFSGGRPANFTMDGLDPPLSAQAALFTSPTGKYLFVADTGNKRVVLFDKADGRFLRQYPTADIGPVNSLWAEEPSGKALLATDNRVHSATLGLP